MSIHSSIVGGSTAARLLNCPGSYHACCQIPPAAEVTSLYAEEGTFAHELMATLMRKRQLAEQRNLPFLPINELQGVLGSHVYDRIVTCEHIDTLVDPALEALIDLESVYLPAGAGRFRVLAVEQSVQFPGVPGARGTVDLVLGGGGMLLHVDWKFGAGIGVQAVYKDSAGEVVNAQLMFYLAASIASMPKLYRNPAPKLVVAIVQPRSDPPFTHTVVARREVKTFREDIEQAIIMALRPDAVRVKGDHCRFAPCRAACPLWTGPLIDLTAIGIAPRQPAAREVTPYAVYLARAKALLDDVVELKRAIDEQLHAYLENGGMVPGWKLKLKIKQRQWTLDAGPRLIELGFSHDEVYRMEMVTFAAAERAAKRLGVPIPDDIRVAPITRETTLATADDPAPAVERTVLMHQFRAALAAVTDKTASLPAAQQATKQKQETGHE